MSTSFEQKPNSTTEGFHVQSLQRSPTKVTAEAVVDSHSIWFSGHFPDNPILPGIAQLKIIQQVIALSRQENLCIKRLSRVKFKKIVRPGDLLTVQATTTEQQTYTFTITSDAQEVCSGTMTLASTTAPINAP